MINGEEMPCGNSSVFLHLQIQFQIQIHWHSATNYRVLKLIIIVVNTEYMTSILANNK